MSKVIYEVRLRLPGSKQADIKRSHLLFESCGVDELSLVESKENDQCYLSFYPDSKTAAVGLIGKMKKMRFPGCLICLKVLKEKDWKTKWKKTFKPFYITKGIRVVPLGLKDTDKRRAEITVIIDTTMAFGTGLHPTTRFMAEFIGTKAKGAPDMLDVGTGSGILAVIAKLCRVNEVWAIDIDKEAVKTARQNISVNKVKLKCLKSVALRRFFPGKRFSFIVANLITDDLLSMREKLFVLLAPGGYLAVSGISESNYRKFRKGFDRTALRCLKVRKEKEWCAVLYRREQ